MIEENYGGEQTIMRCYARDVLGIKGGGGYRGVGAAGVDDLKAKAFPWWEETAREWSQIDSGLVPLLNHSDCDGDLSPEDCARVAPALREAIGKLDPMPDGTPDYDIEKGLLLVQMMETCSEFSRKLAFH